jgi:hypothetical protein
VRSACRFTLSIKYSSSFLYFKLGPPLLPGCSDKSTLHYAACTLPCFCREDTDRRLSPLLPSCRTFSRIPLGMNPPQPRTRTRRLLVLNSRMGQRGINLAKSGRNRRFTKFLISGFAVLRNSEYQLKFLLSSNFKLVMPGYVDG